MNNTCRTHTFLIVLPAGTSYAKVYLFFCRENNKKNEAFSVESLEIEMKYLLINKSN